MSDPDERHEDFALATIELSRCDNCLQVWPDEALDEPRHLLERLDPGGVVPSGQCPDCGALCYPD